MTPQLLTVIEEAKLKDWPDEEWINWQVEAKRDGFRLLIVDGVPQSRTGKPLHNIQHILDHLGNDMKGVVFDGELHGESWQETSHVARATKSDRSDIKLTYTIFDMLTRDEWLTQKCDRPLDARQLLMKKYTPETEHVKFIKPVTCLGFGQFDGLRKHHLAAGCDGTVLKLKGSRYEFKRTRTWLKVKPCLDADGVVVGMKEGTGKYKGMLGALEVLPEGSYIEGDEKVVTTFVSGMSDALRREMWPKHKHYAGLNMIGKTIEVKIRGVHPSGRWIEPRFHRIREDK